MSRWASETMQLKMSASTDERLVKTASLKPCSGLARSPNQTPLSQTFRKAPWIDRTAARDECPLRLPLYVFFRFKARCPLCPRQLMTMTNCGMSFWPQPLSQFQRFQRFRPARKKRSTSPFGKGRTHPAFETKCDSIAAATKPTLLVSAPFTESTVSIIDPAAPPTSSPSVSPKRPCPTVRHHLTKQMYITFGLSTWISGSSITCHAQPAGTFSSILTTLTNRTKTR